VCDWEPNVPVEVLLNVVWLDPSPQLTSTDQGLSAPGSENEPRLKLVLAPSLADWSAGAVTVGGTLMTMLVNEAELVPVSLSVTVTVTV